MTRKYPGALREFRQERGERVLWRGQPVLASFYPLLLAGVFAVFLGVVVLLTSPSALGVALACVAAVFCVSTVFMAEAFRRARTYIVTDRRIRYERRFLATAAREVPLGAVTNVSAGQDIVGRVMNFGNVIVETPAAGVVIFERVRDPYGVAETIRKTVRSHAPKSRFW